MLVTGRDRWLFLHLSASIAYAFYVMCCRRSPRRLWNLVRIQFSAYTIYEPMYTVTLLLQIMYHFFVSSLCNIFMYQMYQMCNTFMSHFSTRACARASRSGGGSQKACVHSSSCPYYINMETGEQKKKAEVAGPPAGPRTRRARLGMGSVPGKA